MATIRGVRFPLTHTCRDLSSGPVGSGERQVPQLPAMSRTGGRAPEVQPERRRHRLPGEPTGGDEIRELLSIVEALRDLSERC